jgi:hypothetical protein
VDQLDVTPGFEDFEDLVSLFFVEYVEKVATT